MLNEYYLIFVLLFDMHVIILYLSYPYFHDSALLLAIKVCSHSYFIYLFVLMLDLFYYSIILLISIDFLVNCLACFTLFSRDPFLATQRGVMTHHHTFPIANLTPKFKLNFSKTCFSFKSHTQGFYFLFCFSLKKQNKNNWQLQVFSKNHIFTKINKKRVALLSGNAQCENAGSTI